MTCRYRCGDACSREAPDASGNAYAGDIIAGVPSRRSVFRAGAVVGVVGAADAAAGSGVRQPHR